MRLCNDDTGTGIWLGDSGTECHTRIVVFRTALYSELSNVILSHVSKWVAANKLVINLHKTNTIKCIASNSAHCALCIGYKEKYAEQTVNTELVDFQTDFPHLSVPALGPTQPPIQCVPGLFLRGRTAGA